MKHEVSVVRCIKPGVVVSGEGGREFRVGDTVDLGKSTGVTRRNADGASVEVTWGEALAPHVATHFEPVIVAATGAERLELADDALMED